MAVCRRLLVYNESHLLAGSWWKEQNRPVHMIQESDGNFVFARVSLCRETMFAHTSVNDCFRRLVAIF